MKKNELIQKLMAKKAARFSKNPNPSRLCIVECCDGGGHCVVSSGFGM